MNYELDLTGDGFAKRNDLNVVNGDTFSIKLKVQLGTGFRWELTLSGKGCVRLLEEPTIQTDKNLKIGTTETQVFRFVAERQGMETIVFRYLRPWQRNNSHSEKIEITVSVA